MMNDVVLIPTFTRPEFLWLCLEHINACPEVLGLDIWVCVDAHAHQLPPMDEIQGVIDQFPFLKIRTRINQPHSYAGNSYNVLSAYKMAFEMDTRYVFLVEDDVIVSPDFFQWHREVQAKEQPVVSIALNGERFKGYASLGVCWKREQLERVVAHACPEYYADMRGYIQRTFPPMPYEYEQDGLICRVVHGRKVVWADRPRAQHVGWYGYHRLKSIKPSGSVEERYLTIKKVLKDEALLRVWSKDFGDVTTAHL